MIVFPNAKINLGLSVIRKRTDGYHDIETVMYPIPMHDVLEFLPSENFALSVYGLKIPGKTEDNLVAKVWELLHKHHQVPPVEVKLLKTIPPGSGLGGGSSDAAFFLKALNDYYHLSLSETTLINYALQLGSDCPFFINNTATLAKGKGEKFRKISLSLHGKFLVVVYPGIHIDTRDAYANVIPRIRETSPGELVRQPLKHWRDKLVNDFELAVFKNYPALKAIKHAFYEEGAIYASLTGSGSAIYAIFDGPIDLRHKFPDFLVWSHSLK